MANKVKLLNINLDKLNFDEAINEIDNLIKKKSCSYVVTPNTDHIVLVEHDAEFKEIYDNADLVLLDGKPLVWLSKWLKDEKMEKISGSDIFPRICELAAKKGYTMYLFGAGQGVAEKAAENLTIKYPGLKIVGTQSPSFGFEKKEKEVNDCINRIKETKPDILIVGLGAPKQEKFIYKYKDELNVPLSLGLGATIDFEAGTKKRAPKWMQNAGLEWLYRSIQEPRRVGKRAVIDAINIVKIVSKYKHT